MNLKQLKEELAKIKAKIETYKLALESDDDKSSEASIALNALIKSKCLI